MRSNYMPEEEILCCSKTCNFGRPRSGFLFLSSAVIKRALYKPLTRSTRRCAIKFSLSKIYWWAVSVHTRVSETRDTRSSTLLGLWTVGGGFLAAVFK